MTQTQTPTDPTPVVTRHEMSPAALLIEPNVRKTVDLNKAFLRSIEANGVLTPVLVKADPTGGYSVIDGQRRTLAAVQLGLPSIPVTLIETIADDAALITTQIIVNDERAEVSSWETAQGIKQLSLLGIPAGQIAKRTGKKKDQVDAALALTETPANASLFADAPQLDLVRAAKIAEFTEYEDLATDLYEHAESPEFDHRVALAEKDREGRLLVAARVADLEGLGYIIFDEFPSYNDAEIKDIDCLSATAEGKAITREEHALCPGRAAKVHYTWDGRLREDHYCTKWKTEGHFNRFASTSSGATAGPQDDAQKAARRHVVEMNKLADAALSVHEAWLTEFFQRPTSARPRSMMNFALTMYDAARNTNEFPSVRDAARFVQTEVNMEMSDRGAIWTFTAMVCGAIQSKMTKDFWRDGREQQRATPMLQSMVDWGYQPAPFERALLDGIDITDPTKFNPSDTL